MLYVPGLYTDYTWAAEGVPDWGDVLVTSPPCTLFDFKGVSFCVMIQKKKKKIAGKVKRILDHSCWL